MPLPDPDFWTRAYRARDKLAEQFLNRPEVSLIDIGYDVENPEEPQRVVLRIHVRRPGARHLPDWPEEIDGIPVRVITGDYRLES